jgi:thiol-disulfide isomerase/thioredoxin
MTTCLFLLAVASYTADAQQDVVIRGTVHDRDSKSFYLIAATQSERAENKIEVPINNGAFQYTLSSRQVEAYEIIYREELERGAWNPVIFFTDTTTVSFDLYASGKTDSNRVIGGAVNRDYYSLNRAQKKLFDKRQQELIAGQRRLDGKDLFHTTAYKSIMARIRAAKTTDERQGYYEEQAILEKSGGHLAPAGKAWYRSYDSLTQAISTWKYEQIRRHTSIAYLYLMLSDLQYRAKTNPFIANKIQQAFTIYNAAFPQHTYTKVINDGLTAIVQIFPGKAIVDVTAPDLNGQNHRLSELIKGKVALIDLWGSWCGPCIAKSRKAVPLYEKYKDKGFTVVAIAREFDNTDELKKRLAQERFNWTHLVELDDRLGIWNKYGIPNSGGMVVLVGRDGKILAVDPTVQELEKQLAVVMQQ